MQVKRGLIRSQDDLVWKSQIKKVQKEEIKFEFQSRIRSLI